MLDPQMRQREEAFKAMLLSWFTIGGFIRAGLALSTLILVLGLTPNLERIMSSDQERRELLSELPLIVLGCVAGGFGALILGMAIALVGGWLITRANAKRKT